MAKIKVFVGMLVILTASGILIAGCENGTNGGGGGGIDSALVAKWYLYPHKGGGSSNGNNDNEIDAPKTLVIQNMPSSVYDQLVANSSSIFICEVGTSAYDASTQGKSVASASVKDATVLSGGGVYTLTLSLFNHRTTTRWTGHGTFDILWPDASYFGGPRASSVNISSGTTTVAYSDFASQTYPPSPPPGL
ncbi:MAG: hypothetical protein LBF78_12800 [Treponema sp.]|jgi:hypothetical protein|nr:hypothetical protein [Treponema sp.]